MINYLNKIRMKHLKKNVYIAKLDKVYACVT